MTIENEPRENATQFYNDFVKKTVFDPQSKRFITELPFKEGCQPGVNRSVAVARLRSLEKSLAKRGLREKYQNEFQSLLDLGFIEPVQDDRKHNGPVSYLPHREVIKEDSLTTKLRIVFDASAKENRSLSLNDALHSGPNLTHDLLGVLMRFRIQKVALLADIEKSFPQVIIHERHRDALRFLWDPTETGEPKTFRLTRNYFGFASSSFILAICIQILLKWHEEKYPETTRSIKRSYYVDDLATGEATVAAAARLYKQTKEIFAHGSFNLRKWTSNSEELTVLFRQNGDGIEEFDSSAWCKVLGMQYNRVDDTMRLNTCNVKLDSEIITKRIVLSITAAVFDRIGIAAPLLLPPKLLIQKMWVLGVAWDDPIPDDMAAEFKEWTKVVNRIGNITIPRTYWQHNESSTKTLHIFCDASQYAYGFCAYAVSRTNIDTSSSLILAKSRVAPLKNTTIPRLELMALTIAAEALDYIRKELPIQFQQEHLWTDNSGVYYQATSANPEKLHVFARNRVTKIQQLARGAEIHHVPGKLNPADLVSRGCNFQQFEESFWLTGPSFIREHPALWPKNPTHESTDAVTKTTEEAHPTFISFVVQREQKVNTQVNFVNEVFFTNAAEEKMVLQFGSCSKWSVFVRAVVRFRRVIDLLKKRTTRDQLNRPILYRELRSAEDFIVSEVQKDAYPTERRCLNEKKLVPKSSKLRVFTPFLQHGLISLGGRLGANVGELPKHPVILPPKHSVTKMILRDIHEGSCHAGPTQVMISARHRYWIPQAKKTIQNIIHSCKDCRRFHMKPATASMGPPPDVRVSRSQPFEHVGTDVLGPLYVRSDDKKDKKKIWVIVYTCCAMRAVHLEVLQSMNTTELLMSLRRFKARRGCPRTFYSDNARAYKRAAEDLKTLCKMMEDTNIQEQLARDGIEWRFSVERAPWYMGFTERLVGSVKSALKKVLGRATVTEQEFMTVLCEVENSINRRPLCEVPEAEHIDVLTPAHFLIHRTEDPTQDSAVPAKIRASDLLKRWRHKKNLVEAVWKRWEHEYLLLLRNFHETIPRDLSTLTIGQVVIIKDVRKPKMLWQLGKVEKVNISRDGIVRSCILKSGSGKLIQRAVNHLYPLEVV